MILFFISLMVVLVNLFVVYVLTSRYFIINWWLMYLFSAIGLHKLIMQWSSLKSRQRLIRQLSLISLLVIYFLNVIIDKSSINHEKMQDNGTGTIFRHISQSILTMLGQLFMQMLRHQKLICMR